MVNIAFSIYAIIFLALLIGSGFIAKKWVSDSDDFIIAGREISLPVNILGVVAIGFAGTSITLAPGFSVLYGIKGGIFWGVIYSLFGLLLYANLFADFIRRSGAQTLPEYFETRYDGKVRGLVAITSVIGMCGILANNIVSLSSIVSGYTGWPVFIITAVGFLVILIFATMSGMWATTITDFIQVTIGTIAVPVFLMILVRKYGGMEYFNTWLSGDWINQGLSGASLPGLSMKYPSVITFAILFGTALVWGNNYYWIKIASCRNEKVARKSYTIGSLYLIIVFMIPLSFIGIYAGTTMPETFTLAGGTIAHTAAYGVIARVITPLLGSVFIVGAAAAALSTSSTSAMGATSTATRDIYKRMINKNATPKETLKASKGIMALIILVTWGMTFFPGGPTYLFAFANAWLTPPAVLLLLGALWPRFNSRGAFWGVLSGMTTMIALTIAELTGTFVIGNWTHMAIVGFSVSLVVGVIAALSTSPKYYGISEWNIKANENNRKDIKLEAFDLKVLEMIRIGHQYLSDITDGLKVDSKISNESIERLDQGGYIERSGLVGSKFFTFSITKNGEAILPKLNENESRMMKEYLNSKYVDFLEIVLEDSYKVGKFAKDHDMGSLQMSSMISHLTRRGYIIEKGMFKRKVEITDKGKSIVSKYKNAKLA
ncbi:sodium:solute symporter family protein [Geosporobacter ferrireducens]|uniref:Sodium:solute symporter n=2 Tax=Geosporobacter ferrireducens TaxID=1424294 RepID=A0A1D8GGC5_9FIRM|nr:sodium:solute symporter family protein [Geosporobacter ferrireducens]AOT69916.1 sodium:solute symporter [Geosporobacter ferrireducens]MTI54388.1 sodium:solute symporter family protein [Geosporobacter ferrireducens]